MPARLASPVQTPQRQKMIEYALEEKAPKMFQRLKRTGQLKTFVQETDRNLLDSFEEAEIKAHQALPRPKTSLENLQNRNEATRRAWEEALVTWLDFSDQDEAPTTAQKPPNSGFSEEERKE